MTPGATTEQTLTHDGLSRRYLVHLPRTLATDRPAPLLLAFHGGGGHAEFMADDARFGLISYSERHGVIVVFPNGASRHADGRLATWNAGQCCGYARDRKIDDVGFVRALVARLRAQLSIDPERIWATGMSNGGMMSQRLACDAADLIRGIASVAGPDETLSCAPSRPVRVLHIHARDDDHVPYDGGGRPGVSPARRQVEAYVSAPETAARWVQRNRCSPAAATVLDVPGARCERWTGCADGVQVQLCSTETGGHSWPGAERVRRGKAPASTALDAVEVLGSFLDPR